MALTAIADTRLLLTLEFPPSDEIKRKVVELTEREISGRLLVSSIALTEFIKIAGARIGESGATTRIRLLKDRGMRTVALREDEVLAAGSLLLSHRNVPIADALIASFVKTGVAEYIVTDDPHYRTLGLRTRWF